MAVKTSNDSICTVGLRTLDKDSRCLIPYVSDDAKEKVLMVIQTSSSILRLHTLLKIFALMSAWPIPNVEAEATDSVPFNYSACYLPEGDEHGCYPGYFKCSNGRTCCVCPDGTFMGHFNNCTKCVPYTSCDGREILFQGNATDDRKCGNATKTVDTSPPVIYGCVQSVEETVELGLPGTEVGWNEPIAIDMSGQPVTMTTTRNPRDFFPVGSTEVVYNFSDPSGNMATCAFNVTVIEVDRTPPTIMNCPKVLFSKVEMGTESMAHVVWLTPTVTDLSNTARLQEVSHDPGTRFPVGTTQVTYTYADESNNVAKCQFDVIVWAEDTKPPEIEGCPHVVRATVKQGSHGTNVQWKEPTASDRSGQGVTVTKTHEPNSYFHVGTTTVIYTFQDTSGNSDTCVISAIVEEGTSDGHNSIAGGYWVVIAVLLLVVLALLALSVVLAWKCWKDKDPNDVEAGREEELRRLQGVAVEHERLLSAERNRAGPSPGAGGNCPPSRSMAASTVSLVSRGSNIW